MGRTGWILTIFWVLAFGLLIYFNKGSVEEMSLNEWGDFLAGFAAPLALLWLIVGYQLQKNELKMNTETLKDQHIELSRQVDELSKQNNILIKQNKVLESSVEATLKLSDAIDNISDTYDGWRRNG